MSESGLLFLHDAYLRTFTAHVAEVRDGTQVVLDRTAFYPTGGGQPHDTGSLGDRRVLAVRKEGDRVRHTLDGPAPAVGEEVAGEVDWDRRHALMRTHTALHVLCGVVWRDYAALVTGGNMEPGAGRMDFEFERMSGDLVDEIEARVNHELGLGREVRVNVLPRDEAFAIPDLIRTKINLLPEGITEVRVIEIVGLDLQADGGTHVARTSEIGRVKVTGYESKGRINKRIRIELLDPVTEA